MYKHTQIGWVILTMTALIILVVGYGAVKSPTPFPAVTGIILLIVLFLFGSLTVVGENDKLTFYFGLGVVRKRIRYDEINSVEKVRNSWYCGWGIRWYGRGWLYNVSGLDAIEFVLTNGKQLRIGTDEPDRLLMFLRSKIQP
jgi:hypothetical protein